MGRDPGAVGIESDVVATHDEARRLDRRPLIVLDRLGAFLDRLGLGTGPLSADRIAGGSSNVTFEVRRGSVRLVVRRPPRPPFPPSTHNVVREAKLQLALRDLGVRVPEVLAVCDDPEIIGAPFYVMRYVEGDVITDRLPPRLVDVADRRDVAEDLVDALVEIHAADPTVPALQPFRRHGNYLERQVRRFSELWERTATREVQPIGAVAAWLVRTMPAPLTSTVVHGDFRLGNVIVATEPRTRIAAVIDWELGAIGDPRADLGYLAATYSHQYSNRTVMELSPVTASTGFPTKDDLVNRYATRSGRPVDALPWFEVLALWKSAVFLEGMYRRFLAGEMPGNALAASLQKGVPEIAAIAASMTVG